MGIEFPDMFKAVKKEKKKFMHRNESEKELLRYNFLTGLSFLVSSTLSFICKHFPNKSSCMIQIIEATNKN